MPFHSQIWNEPGVFSVLWATAVVSVAPDPQEREITWSAVGFPPFLYPWRDLCVLCT